MRTQDRERNFGIRNLVGGVALSGRGVWWVVKVEKLRRRWGQGPVRVSARRVVKTGVWSHITRMSQCGCERK